MGESTKFNVFKSTHVAEWEVAAREELKGANPWEKLTHREGDLSILPFYDRNEELVKPLLSPAKHGFLGPRTWYNCPLIPVSDPAEANRRAHECLLQGADGIVFELSVPNEFEILLKGIDQRFCSLNFLAVHHAADFAAALQAFSIKTQSEPELLPGAFFGNLPPSTIPKSPLRLSGHQFVHLDSPADEIASGFLHLIGGSIPLLLEHATQVAVSISLGTDFFVELAKLRALRTTWMKIVANSASADIPLFIHARSEPWLIPTYLPHGNMLKGTTAAMAAILGGCDVLSVEPEQDDQGMMSRAARNVSNLLREESYFSKVADPVAGSYFLEELTRQIADEAWKKIKQQLPS